MRGDAVKRAKHVHWDHCAHSKPHDSFVPGPASRSVHARRVIGHRDLHLRVKSGLVATAPGDWRASDAWQTFVRRFWSAAKVSFAKRADE